MLYVTNHISYLGGLSNSFSNSFIDFHSCEVVSSSEKERHIKLRPLRIHNRGCFETLNLPHVSSFEMFTFCNVLHDTKQKRKQTLESAQCVLENRHLVVGNYLFSRQLHVIDNSKTYSVASELSTAEQ